MFSWRHQLLLALGHQEAAGLLYKQPVVQCISVVLKRSRMQWQHKSSHLERDQFDHTSHQHPATDLPGLVATTDMNSAADQFMPPKAEKQCSQKYAAIERCLLNCRSLRALMSKRLRLPGLAEGAAFSKKKVWSCFFLDST